MKIALIGYGKMGKTIESLAIEKGHQIVLKIQRENAHELTPAHLAQADVCIEFSSPNAAFHLVSACLNAGKPTVCGTTAWLDQLDEAKTLALNNNTAFLYASNFSLGVNLFFEINRFVSKLLSKYPQYHVTMEEIHHTQKKDAPSGTAVTLAEDILREHPTKTCWVNAESIQPEALVIRSLREDPAPGTHSIAWESNIDSIEIKHTAHSRTGFAAGALMAAEFLVDKKGIFTMNDVLNPS
ncbi:MAG: 4-hydroxy-tetrahydrodipicolinate reductase [Chitinophagaceae bacterium]|nr:4-hydroxy-tetrahydrodipicolinate reductase [Chitinophagaceae bacterium]